MIVVEKLLRDLAPYPNNPRQNAGAVAGVAESIARFGFKQPIVIDAQGVIVCGHTRYLAAKKLGLTSVPCVMADDLSETELKAYRLLDNKLHEQTFWDPEALAKELDSFEFDFSPFEVDFEADVPPIFTPDVSDEEQTFDLDDDNDGGDNDGDRLPRSFQLVVDCGDEATQEDLYERLTLEGYRVRTCCL